MRPLACLLGLALLAAAGPARAEADDSAAIDKIVKLNKRAVDEYENLNFDEARKILTGALAACTQSGLDNQGVAARTHVHLGVVLFAGFKQKDQALKEFRKALDIQADIKLDKTLANPEIQAVFDEAGGGQNGAAAATAPPAAAGDAVTHDPVTRAEQGKDIPISVTVDSSVAAKKVVLSFSADGSEDFGERELKEASPGNWSGEIPASATEGAKVRYYIEVSGADDQTLATKGTATEPLVVALQPAAGAAPPMNRNTVEVAPKKEEEVGPPSWYFGLGIGTGFGWTTGTGEINSLDHVSPPGFAAAKLGQLVPEVGYFVTPQLLVSFQFRYQLVTGATAFYATDGSCGPSTVCSPASYALAGFGRASWLFDLGSLHPFVGGTLGGGTIRHLATFASEPHCGSNHTSTCIDTIASGPIFVGGTGGLLYNLSPFFALKAETNVVAGFTKFTFNFDFNLGIAVEY
jgi:hypothetical protein